MERRVVRRLLEAGEDVERRLVLRIGRVEETLVDVLGRRGDARASDRASAAARGRAVGHGFPFAGAETGGRRAGPSRPASGPRTRGASRPSPGGSRRPVSSRGPRIARNGASTRPLRPPRAPRRSARRATSCRPVRPLLRTSSPRRRCPKKTAGGRAPAARRDRRRTRRGCGPPPAPEALVPELGHGRVPALEGLEPELLLGLVEVDVPDPAQHLLDLLAGGHRRRLQVAREEPLVVDLERA